MPYLLDSDVVIDFLAQNSEAGQLLARLAPEGVSVSVVTYMEVLEGVLAAPNQTLARARFEAFVNDVPVLDFNPIVAERCAQMRRSLRQQKRRVNGRMMDLMVAATAITFGLMLVTRNVHDFADVPGLRIYKSAY